MNISLITKPALEPGDYPNNMGEGWTHVIRKKKSPSKIKTIKESLPASVPPVPVAKTTAKVLTEATTGETTITESIATHPVP